MLENIPFYLSFETNQLMFWNNLFSKNCY